MDEKKVLKFKQQLVEEYQKLIPSIERKRSAEEEIHLENTEDEWDLATISQSRDLLHNLYENDFQRLRNIEEGLKRLDHGDFGECERCGEPISEKRLIAVPWATMCIGCQEEAENAERDTSDSRSVMAGMLTNDNGDDNEFIS